MLLIVRHVYPVLFVAATVLLAADQLSEALMKWAQSVRDTEYLVDLRLQNMDDKNASSRNGHIGSRKEPQVVDDLPPLEVVE